MFLKSLGCINGPNDDVVIPRGSVKTDYEVELGVVIGVGGSYISEAKALEHVAGYTVVNDVRCESGVLFTWLVLMTLHLASESFNSNVVVNGTKANQRLRLDRSGRIW